MTPTEVTRTFSDDQRSSGLRAAVGNALTWGAGWGGAAFAVLVAVKVFGTDVSWGEGLGLAARFAVIGTVSGMAFSAVIRRSYRGRRLAEISWWRFGLRGGVATALFIPCFLSVMRLLSGEGILPLEFWLSNMTVGAVFGSVAAGGTVKIAQLAGRALPRGSRDQLDAAVATDRLATGE
jgi:hypothetical protein